MKSILVVVATAAILASGAASAQSGAKAKGCLNCHEMDKKKVGPAIKDIAAKYKDDKGAEGTLTAKLKEGKGHPKSVGSDAELKAALQYMLTGK